MGTDHPRFYSDIEGWMLDGDLEALGKLCHRTVDIPHPILEIGSFCGLSAAVLSECGAHLVCIDPFLGGEDLPDRDTSAIFVDNMRRLGRLGNITILRGRSEDVLPLLSAMRFRLIFIDGSHEFESVKSDISMALSLLADGGIIVLDDIFWGANGDQPVMHAVNALGLTARFKAIYNTKMGLIQ